MRAISLKTIAIAMLLGACDDTKATDTKPVDTKPAAEPIDPAAAKTLADAREMLATVSKDQRNLLGGKALAFAEAERLPTKLAEAFEKLPRFPPDDRRWSSATDAIARPDVIPTLERLCEGNGVATVKAVAAAAPGEQIGLAWDGCKLERAELLTRVEADTADIGSLLLAFVGFQVMRDKGGPSADERELLRAFVIDSAKY